MSDQVQIAPYIFLDGSCREAFTHYQTILGGKLTAMMTARDLPGMAEQTPPEHLDRIMHACLAWDGRQMLMGSDGRPGHHQRQQGFCVQFGFPTAAEAERVFAALAEGGEMGMPMMETSWAERFGMVTDRFGTPWIINGAMKLGAAPPNA